MNARLVIALSTVVIFGSIWLGIVVILRAKKNANLVDLLFFTIFYIYLYKVLDYTLFQFQTLLVLKHFMPNLMLNGVASGESVNLVPLVTLTVGDLRTSLLNILLMVPFGFGLPFIVTWRAKSIVVVGALFSVAIELVQLATGWMAQMTFRVADINDVIFNTTGVFIGYVLFAGFVHVYLRVSRNWNVSPATRHFLATRVTRSGSSRIDVVT